MEGISSTIFGSALLIGSRQIKKHAGIITKLVFRSALRDTCKYLALSRFLNFLSSENVDSSS
jgi:hypothetical protein